MLVIGENLKQLIQSEALCDSSLFDDFSITIRLGDAFYEPRPQANLRVVYDNHPDATTIFSEKKLIEQNLELKPGGSVITCSGDKFKIPLDHFGLVQTKGTLARLFVQITCNDGQIEPGFQGYITLEIVNLSPWIVELPKFSAVGQLFILKTSTHALKGYQGRYAGVSSNGPTLPIFRLGR